MKDHHVKRVLLIAYLLACGLALGIKKPKKDSKVTTSIKKVASYIQQLFYKRTAFEIIIVLAPVTVIMQLLFVYFQKIQLDKKKAKEIAEEKKESKRALEQQRLLQEQLKVYLNGIKSKLQTTPYKQLPLLIQELQSKGQSQYPWYNTQIEKMLLHIYTLMEKALQRRTSQSQQSQKSTLAHYYCCIVNKYIQLNEPIENIRSYKVKIQNIYVPSLNIFFQEYITIVNNIALYYTKHGLHRQSIDILEQLQVIQAKYLSKGDDRKIIVKNNLGCSYCEIGEKKKGLTILDECLAEIEPNIRQTEASDLQCLIQKNKEHYLST